MSTRQITRSNRTAGVMLAGLCISAWLVVLGTGLMEEKPDDILAKIAVPIKDAANLRELEGTTFHVINITEHDSVLPAELRLTGKESDWVEGIIGYVDGKEVPTGLIPASDHVRLMVGVPLKPNEAKKVTFKKGKGTAVTDLKVKQDGPRIVVANKQANWQLGPNGLEQFDRNGKIFTLQETGISYGTLKATLTPAVCRVTLQAEGAGTQEYLFYPNSSIWQVNADKNYKLFAGGTNAFYYAHPCSMFFGDPGSVGAVFETSELEKGTPDIPGLKKFHLFSAVDWGLLMGSGVGLGIYPNPSSFSILVDATARLEHVTVHAVPMDNQSKVILEKWHGAPQRCGCGWWRTRQKLLGETVSYVFGVATDVNEGNVQRSESLAPVVLRSLDGQLHGAQLPWITANRSETIFVEDLNGNGPDMLNDRLYWCNNGKPMSCFEFSDPNKDGLLDTVEIYAKWGDKDSGPDSGKLKLDDVTIQASGDDKSDALDAMELKYPVYALHDWTHDGKIVANCVFFGGRVDQDWYEFNVGVGSSSPPDRQMLEREKPDVHSSQGGVQPLLSFETQKFNRASRALDLDNDGDVDIIRNIRRVNDPDTDYGHIEGRDLYHSDIYDNNPFHGFLMEPFTGDLALQSGFQWPFFLGNLYKASFRYKGVPVVGQDAVMGNMCLDGDGLPETKLIYDGVLLGDDFCFRPVMNMICSSLYLGNRHALSRINHMEWQEGLGTSSCYRQDVGLFPIRKGAGWPFDGTARLGQAPQRPAQDCLRTYRDKHSNEINIIGIDLPAPGWDGRLVAGSRDPAIVKDWSDSLHYDWDYLLAGFEGYNGVMTESGYPNHIPRLEFCADYAQRREAKVFYSELDGRLHLKGASWGQNTRWHTNPKRRAILDEWGSGAMRYLHEGYSCLDCDNMRYYAPRHEAFFDEDRDGYLDSFLVDGDNDGWYEERAWYDRASRMVYCMKDGVLVMWPHKMEPYPEEELLVDTEHYDKLVTLKRMSEERTSVLNGTSIKAQPLSISVPGSNLWVGINADLLPQVLLDTAHCEAGIWCDLSPKGYSRLLTGLQRQRMAVRELKEKWSEESLRGASVLFVVPPYTAKPDADELKALDSFLKGGGQVVVAFPDWSIEPKGAVYALKTAKPLVPGSETADWKGPQGIDLMMKWGTTEAYDVKIHVDPRWDEKYFYLYAEVYDRDLINKETGADIWKGDCIQFALGDLGRRTWGGFGELTGMGAKECWVRAQGLKWREFVLARTEKGPQIYRAIDVPVIGGKGPVAKAKLAVTRRENRTIYQLALPWTEIGQTELKHGTEIGFSLAVADRTNDQEIQSLALGGGIVDYRNPTVYQKLVLLDTAEPLNISADAQNAGVNILMAPEDDKKVSAGARVASPLDACCVSYGISRNNERTALVPANDPHFRKRELGPQVRGRFVGDPSNDMMKGIRKLFFNGSSLAVGGSAAVLVQYQDKIIAAKAKVGNGELLALCSELMLNNKHSCFYSVEGGGCALNEFPLDKPIDVKPDNNVFLDNLARYLAANSRTFKVLEASDAQLLLELVSKVRLYAKKGTKALLGSGQAIDGKADGDILCFDVPVSKEPVKLKISR